jgi:hypothetical protein
LAAFDLSHGFTAHTGSPSLRAVARGEAWCQEGLRQLAGRHQLSRAAMYRPVADPWVVDPLDWGRPGPGACRTESRQVDLQTDRNVVGAANVLQSPAPPDPGRKPCIRKEHGGARRLFGFSAWPRGFFADAARKPSPGGFDSHPFTSGGVSGLKARCQIGHGSLGKRPAKQLHFRRRPS